MREGALYSAILHLSVILLAIIGLPHLMHKPLEMEEAVPVEIVTIAEKANVPPMAPKPEPPPPKPEVAIAPPPPPPLPEPPQPVAAPAPPPTPEPPKPIALPAPPAPEPPKQIATPAPQAPEPAPTPPDPPKPEPPQVAAIPQPPPPDTKAKPRPEPPKPEPQAKIPPAPIPPAPPKQQPSEQELASILKNVEQPRPKSQETDLKTVLQNVARATPAPQPDMQSVVKQFARPTKPTTTALDSRLTMSEIDAVRRQIEGCWNIPAGAKDAKNLVVELRVQLNSDGSVRNVSITDQSRLGSDSFFRAAAESAARAVRECAPLRLPPDKYATWQDMILSFNPSEIL